MRNFRNGHWQMFVSVSSTNGFGRLLCEVNFIQCELTLYREGSDSAGSRKSALTSWVSAVSFLFSWESLAFVAPSLSPDSLFALASSMRLCLNRIGSCAAPWNSVWNYSHTINKQKHKGTRACCLSGCSLKKKNPHVSKGQGPKNKDGQTFDWKAKMECFGDPPQRRKKNTIEYGDKTLYVWSPMERKFWLNFFFITDVVKLYMIS